MTRYAITGSSGYIASRLIERLRKNESCQRIIGLDVVEPLFSYERFEHRHFDVRDKSLGELLERERVDKLLHLAYVFNPTHNLDLEHDVNVEGSANALNAAAEAGLEQVLITSSTTSYGALADNPPLLTEDMELRAGPALQYAKDKRELDQMCQDYAKQHPEIAVAIVRPCIVMGPNIDNIMSRGLTMPLNLIIDGQIPEIQFIHEDDVALGIELLLDQNARGIFNLVGKGTLTLEEIYELKGKGIRLPLPAWLTYALARVTWAARLSRIPPGGLDLFRYRWVADGTKAREELGFDPEYSTRQIWESYLAYIEEHPRPILFRPRLKLKR